MPDTLAQRLSDELTIRDIELLRLSAGDEARFEAQVEALAEELARRVIRQDPTAVGPGAAGERLDDIIASSLPIIRDFYRGLLADFRQQLIDTMVAEANAITRAVAASMGIPGGTAEVLVGERVPRGTMREILDNRVISANANDAERLRGFFEREAASHHRRFSGALRQAFNQDETITQMINRLKEVTEIVARELDAIIRTGYNHAVNQLRIEMVGRNSILFRGVVWVSRLDSRTSPVCQGRSQGMWDLSTGRPLPESPVQGRFPGPPPAHINCRSQLHPLTRTDAEMAAMGGTSVQDALASLTPEQRRLLSPDPPVQETYDEWLRRQSAETQNDVLGPTRRKLWLEGKLTLQEMVTQKGRPLTLKQLERRVNRRDAA